jgi:hypothetical protein
VVQSFAWATPTARASRAAEAAKRVKMRILAPCSL